MFYKILMDFIFENEYDHLILYTYISVHVLMLYTSTCIKNHRGSLLFHWDHYSQLKLRFIIIYFQKHRPVGQAA